MASLADLKTPGVYIQEIPTLPSSIVGVETAIPAFIGYVERMTINGQNILSDANREIHAVRISSMKEYLDTFGEPKTSETTMTVTIDETVRTEGTGASAKEVIESSNIYVKSITAKPKFLMYYQIQMYFANGGGPCYIIPVAAYPAAPVKDDMAKKLTEVLVAIDEPTLIVFPDAASLAVSDMYELYKAALLQCSELKDRFTIIDMENTKNASDNFRGEKGIGNSKSQLRYGAAYHPWLRTGIEYAYEDAMITIEHKKTVKDAAPPPPTTTEAGPSTTTPDTTPTASPHTEWNGKKLNEIPQSNAYFNQIKQAIRAERLVLPPSAAMAGVYAFVDNARGVWKAPANVGLNNVNGLSFYYTDEEQKSLNIDLTGGKSINIIRSFTGQGIVVWGARTLDGNDNEWKYVNVRRFFNYVEESVKKAMNAYVFEPNDANTWVKVRASIESFLRTQWQAGALQGAKPEQAYFVRVGLNVTMSADDILNGRLIVDIGMAVVRPAEFIVLRFMHKLAES